MAHLKSPRALGLELLRERAVVGVPAPVQYSVECGLDLRPLGHAEICANMRTTASMSASLT